MSRKIIEKNKQDNIDLLQIEQFSDLPVSEKDIVVIESNNTIAITIRKFLIKIGFENIQICKEMKEGIQVFTNFIKNDINTPIVIDSDSNRSIKKNIKEIFEIQPNANVVVSTVKGKTDPIILKLFEMGVSSILHKPIVFEDFKESFSNMIKEEATEEQFEKLDMLQKRIHELESQIKTGLQISHESKEPDEQERSELLLTSHKKITDNRFKDMHNIEPSRLNTTFKNLVNDKTIILEREVSEASCNQCMSTNISYTSECPQCQGSNFEQKDLVEHYDCGEIYPKESGYQTCPKCNKNIGSVGTDYREFAGYHVCSSCNERFSRPLFKFSCFNCGNSFIDVMAIWKKSKIYTVQK